MATTHSRILFALFGIVLLHTALGQTATSTSGTGKAKPDQSTVVWSVSTDTLDPVLNSGTAGSPQSGQPEVNTISSVNKTQSTKETFVAMVTTAASLRQETTNLPTTASPTSPQIVLTTKILTPATRAPPSQLPVVVAPDPTSAAPNIRTDVTDTVMALLNETGYSGSANDANVQEIVAMLMNGTVPTDADLIRLGFIPQPAPVQASTPAPFIIPVNPPVLDTNIPFPTGNQVGPSPGIQPGPSIGGFPTGGFPIGGFPSSPQIGTPTGPQSVPGTGTGSGTDPFGGALASPVGGGGTFPNFPSLTATSPKPALGDPFGLNTIAGGAGFQLPSLGTNPNALGPKPFPSGGPIGGLGTPGSTTDLLGSLGTPPVGIESLPPAPQTGILDAPRRPRNRGGMMNNPMMMMMMMNPELMDQAMSGENPMLMYMLMQQMTRRPQRPRHSLTPGMETMPGLGAGSGMSLPLPGSPTLGGGSGGLMDLMNTLGPAIGGASLPGAGLTPGGAPPMDLTALAGMGAPAGPSVAGLGGNPMDLIPSAGPASGGTPAGPTDMSAFLNMMNAAPAGTAASAAPLTDPFVGTVG